MPISTFHGLNTALRGILAHQRSLDVTGHNVANTDTVGYSRQEATLGTTTALRLPVGTLNGSSAYLGSGVDVQSYKRIRDGFLDLQYRAQNMRLGDQEAQARSLDLLELSFQEPGETGIKKLMDNYFDAWSAVSNKPADVSAKTALVEQGKTLALAFNQLDQQMAAVGTAAAEDYKIVAGDLAALPPTGGLVGTIATELAQINGQIKEAGLAGGVPNDLMDRRDVLLDDLSKLGQVSVVELANGSSTVSFGDAALPLVSDTTATWPQALTVPGGKLGALLQLSKPGGTVDAYRTELAGAAKTLADSVNGLHAPGAFFSYTAGNEASTLGVAATAATVRTSASAAVGANEVALQISELRTGAGDSAYRALVSRVGQDVQDIRRQEANATALLASVDERRMSTSGVSLDEEMTNLVRFQRGYQASARAMNSIDEMLDQLINRTGRVGL